MQAHQDKAQSRTPDSNPSAAAADGLDAPVPAERTPAAAQPSGPSQQAAGQQAAGQQQRSKGQLCVGDRVEVLAVNKTVAAVGCVTATEPGCLLSQHPDDSTAKVSLAHHNTRLGGFWGGLGRGRCCGGDWLQHGWSSHLCSIPPVNTTCMCRGRQLFTTTRQMCKSMCNIWFSAGQAPTRRSRQHHSD